MKSVKAFFCDFGGVLYKTPDMRWLLHFQRFFGRKVEDTPLAMFISQTPSAYTNAVMSGIISEDEVWENLIQELRIPPKLVNHMRSAAISQRRLNHPMIQYLNNLRPRFLTAILTNAASNFRATYCQSFDMENWVDRVIISAEIGMAKPDPQIFHKATQLMGVSPEESVFIDDLPDNIKAARAAGMQSYQFTDVKKIIPILDQVLNQAGL